MKNNYKIALLIDCDTVLVRTLRTAVEQTADDNGWAHLGKVGQYISNNSSFSHGKLWVQKAE